MNWTELLTSEIEETYRATEGPVRVFTVGPKPSVTLLGEPGRGWRIQWSLRGRGPAKIQQCRSRLNPGDNFDRLLGSGPRSEARHD